MVTTRVPELAVCERGLVGAVLLRPNLAGDAAGQVGDSDLSDPRVRKVYDAILSLWRRGVEPNQFTVTDELRVTGKYDDLPTGYLTTLQAEVPSPNLDSYVRVILDAALRRRLALTGKTIATIAEDTTVEAGDTLDQAKELLGAIEVPLSAPSEMTDVDTFCAGEDRFDWLIPHIIERGDRILVVAAEAAGKALDVTTPILTLRGWSTMGALCPGDEVFAPDGKPTTVQWCSKVQVGRPCYAVRFDDGSEIVVDQDHQWETVTYHDRQGGRWVGGMRTTKEIAATLRARGGHVVNHAIACAAPPQFPPDTTLPVDPYTLGAWLGDGTSRSGGFTNADPEIIERIRAAGWVVTARTSPAASKYGWWIGRHPEAALRRDTRAMSLSGRLRALNLLQNKHIPERYFRCSPEQRLELLRGLLDTDGHIAGGGRLPRIELSLCNRRLAADAYRLALSLGIKAKMGESDATLNGQVVGRRWRITFQTNLPVFALSRKAVRQTPLRTRTGTTRYIVAVEPVESRPVRCISVDHPDSLFLAGERLIATHNSFLLRQIAVCSAFGIHPFSSRFGNPVRVAMLDFENPPSLVRRKLRPILHKAKQMAPLADATMMSVVCKPGGIDVSKRTDASWLASQLSAVKPDLVVAGPLYKMFRADDKWEQGAHAVTTVLDDLRTRLGFALVLETHAPQEFGGRRNLRPIGSSLWLRWPEFVLTFAPTDKDPHTVRLTVSKGRDERPWPVWLKRGGEWPWTPCGDPDTQAVKKPMTPLVPPLPDEPPPEEQEYLW